MITRTQAQGHSSLHVSELLTASVNVPKGTGRTRGCILTQVGDEYYSDQDHRDFCHGPDNYHIWDSGIVEFRSVVATI